MGMADTVEANEESSDANAQHVKAEAKGPAKVDAPMAEPVKPAPPTFVVPQMSHVLPSFLEPQASAVDAPDTSAMAMAKTMAQGPSIHVVPATPQDSQEKVEHAMLIGLLRALSSGNTPTHSHTSPPIL